MRTTFFTCCNKKYEYFIPIFLHSILYHNLDADVEIGVEDLYQNENIVNSVNYIKNIYPNNKIELSVVDFGPIKVDNKLYNSCPHIIRFINTPNIKNDFVYICDIDIITLQKNISQIHINDMNSTGLNYSNIVRPYTDNSKKRLTGLHFTKWDNYYPIPNFDDLIIQNMLNNDEIFLCKLIEKNNTVSETHTFRPVHGIHISLNRSNVEEWGIKRWRKEWLIYRNTPDFCYLEKLFDVELTDSVRKIDNYYNKIEKIFTDKYINNSWKGSESKSGPGSSLNRNLLLLEKLENFVFDNNIKTIIDCGCGDFNWMKKFNFSLIEKYVGVDVVNPVIKNNNDKYSNDIISFTNSNLIEDDIDKFDLILCKDVLFHLSYDDSLSCLNNFKRSNSTFLISTTFDKFKNKDIISGDWRPINLETEPFLLGSPLIYWHNIEKNDNNKGLAVWKLNI